MLVRDTPISFGFLLIVAVLAITSAGTAAAQQEGPTAEFTVSPSDPLPDEQVTFDATDSTTSADSIESYEWSYEVSDSYSDATASGTTFSHSFKENGNYEVTLTIEDSNGTTDSITKTVQVSADDPTASFTVSPSDPLPDEDVSFDASGSTAPAGSIESYEWSYEVSDSYSDETITGSSFSHTFEQNGNYDVTLTVEDNGGATDSTTKTVSVDAEDPTASFTVSPSDPLPDEDVSFDASGSTAPAGSIESYEWSYEVSDSYSDETITGSSFSHTFEQNGNYDVTLTVEDNGGATTSTTKTVTVGGEDPTASFTISPSDPLPDEEVSFDASGSTAPAGSIESYEWSYEVSDSYSDETITGSSFSHTYTKNGEYDVTLTVEDNGGATASTTKTVTVGGEDPTAKFSIGPSEPSPGEEVTFDAVQSTAPAGGIESYEWSYEVSDSYEDETATGNPFSHTYDTPGEYDVTLKITDIGGSTDSITKTVSVGGEGPSADFAISPESPRPHQKVTFDASDSTTPAGEIVSYQWAYTTAGYTDTATGDSFSHSFETYGKYKIRLRITNSYDQTATVTKSVEVGGPGPTADFEIRPENPGLNERITFDPSPSRAPDLEIIEYRWYINGERQYTDGELIKSFDEASRYNIELEVEDRGGKVDRVSKTVPIGAKEAIIDNPDFELRRSSPESREITATPDEIVAFDARIDSEEIPEATKSFFVDGKVVGQSRVRSQNLRSTYQFETEGEHTVEMEVTGAAGKSDIVQWTVTTHSFNSLPTIAEQSSTQNISVSGKNELLTFSIRNPDVNQQEIAAEIVAELPDGVSISSASGVSTGDSAIQTSTETVAPGRQNTMRLSIVVEDESLVGEQLNIPYKVRYYSTSNDGVIFTTDERSLSVVVTDPSTENTSTEDFSPGFGLPVAVVTILSIVICGKLRSTPKP